MTRRFALTLVAIAVTGFVAGSRATAEQASAAPAGNCKAFGTGKCCDAAVTAHLSKDAIFNACGESDATFLGEKGEKETCKYYFKVEGEKDSEMYVQVYAPAVKGAAPSTPPDPFVSWKKAVGKVMIAEPKSLKGATDPKVKAMAGDGAAIGLYLPGNGFFVLISSSSKICSKTDAKRLAASVR